MQIIFHGTRGSSSLSIHDCLRYGGNTTSIEVLMANFRIIFDAGTGFQNINFNHSNLNNVLLLSHFHHDHIQGLASNTSIFEDNYSLTITSDLCDLDQLKKILFSYFSPPYFPINLFNRNFNLNIVSFRETVETLASDIKLKSICLNHPGGACGYSIETQNEKVVILLDNEFCSSQIKQLMDFCEDSDVVVWDGMYTDAELCLKKGWGHSSIEQALEFSKYTDAKKIIIAHHSTFRTDTELNSLASLYEQSKLFFAYDGMVLDISA